MKKQFRANARADDRASYPDVHTGRRAFLGELAMIAGGALASVVHLACEPMAGVVEGPSLYVSAPRSTLTVGESVQLKAHYSHPLDGDGDVTLASRWSSDLPDTASVDQRGLVRSKAVGSAQITAIWGEFEGHCLLRIEPPGVHKFEIVPATASVGVQATLILTAWVDLVDGTREEVTADVSWSSSDPQVAVVSKEVADRGHVTGVTPGQVAITATMNTKAGHSANAVVTVAY